MSRTRRLSEPVDLADAADPGAAFHDALASGRLLRLPTSGSTGDPRRVLRTPESWRASFRAVSELAQVDRGTRMWVPGPRRSTMTLFALVHVHHARGVAVPSPDDATHATLTPAQLDALLAADALRPGLVVVVAGDRLPAAAADRAEAAGLQVHHYYGAAELSFVAWGRHAGDLRPFPGVAVQERGGELWVRSAFLCEGYDGPTGPFRRGQDGAATVGDRGEVLDGRVVVHGRPDAVVTAGATVHLADVEAALAPQAHGRVVAVGVPRGDVGAVVAVVLTDAADRARLHDSARAGLTDAARPRLWFHAPVLPVTAAGKVDRDAVARAIVDGRLARLR